MKLAYVTLLFAALVCATAAKPADKGCVYSDYRLPQRIEPEHYDLRLDVDTDKFKYQGKVSIILSAKDTRVNDDQSANKILANNVIVLHANTTIAIDDVQFRHLDREDNNEVHDDISNKIENICRYEENELLVISLKDELANQAKGELIISFHANISDDPDYLMGFYKNVYKTKEGEEKAIVSTQFEAAAARKAFPCFDEPNFKATFDVTLVHDPKLVALSNGAVDSEQTEPETGRRVTKFKRTPRMSTYLVAYAIGDLEYIEQVVSDGRLRIRAYTLPGKVEEARLSLETAVRAIVYMEEYFDIPFVMDKIDMVALPNFKTGAMENWGLIFYVDHMFLYDPINTVARDKGIIQTTVVHELAHQWFGNLVTMNWWNDLWLNEGFATWMQDYVTNQLFPELEWDYQYLRGSQIAVLNVDSKPETHSCQVEKVGRNLDTLFNKIVYKKTAAILRQIHDDCLGPERFREGIRRYIKEHIYKNTQASDLWDALKDSNELPVDELMKSWIMQPGHPEVEVKLDSGSKLLRLKQKRYFSAVPSEEQKRIASEQKWIIPISLIVADDKGNTNTIKLIMNTTETQVELPDWFKSDNHDHWVKLNAGFKGFYRSYYSRDLLMRLEKPCRSKELETNDRVNLIYDIFFGGNSIAYDNNELYGIMDWFSEDYEGIVMLLKDDAFFHSSRTRYFEDIIFKMQNLLKNSYIEIYKRQGFRIDSSESSQTDAQAISMAFLRLAQHGYLPVVQDALSEFNKHSNKGDVDLRMPMYWAVAYNGSEEQIAKLRKIRYAETDHPDEIRRIDSIVRGIKKRWNTTT